MGTRHGRGRGGRLYKHHLAKGVVRPADVDDDAVMRVFRVPPELAGMRLDRFLQGELRSTSRTRSQAIVARAAFTPGGDHLRKNHRVRAEERVVLWRAPWDELIPVSADELSIVHEDDALLALNKPPFVPVHPTGRYFKSTVTEMMAQRRPDEHLTLVHRLDRETSGILLMARNAEADRAVKIQIEARTVVKRYLAITWGAPEAWEKHTCELPIELHPAGRYKVSMRVAAAGQGLASATTFEVLERLEAREKVYTLMRCTLHTGRQHQIRVHLAALGLPIVGDKLYGPDEELHAKGSDRTIDAADLELLEHDRQALHAHEMEFDHPGDGRRIHLKAPLFADLQRFWDDLRQPW